MLVLLPYKLNIFYGLINSFSILVIFLSKLAQRPREKKCKPPCQGSIPGRGNGSGSWNPHQLHVIPYAGDFFPLC